MTIDFHEYVAGLANDAAQHREALESAWQEATRIMSPRGIENYREGIRAMSSVSRDPDLVLTFVEEMPEIAREVGEDVIPDVVSAVMKLASHTSGAVLTLLVANLPLAARRLGDADVLRGFLSLVHQLVGKAPRALRPMLANLDELLGKLTLGGLRRWALWGVSAHQRDVEGQVAYFGLESETARAVLQKERRGTLFVDNQRKLNAYLRALWGRAFYMRPTSLDYETREGVKPYIEHYQVHVPDAYDDFHDVGGMLAYRAAAAHCAAHLVYTRSSLSAGQLAPAQMRMVELFEDARVEYLAMGDFPGLGKLWRQFFDTPAANDEQLHPVVTKMIGMARCLLDAGRRGGSPAVDGIAKTFLRQIANSPFDGGASYRAGLAFHEELSSQLPMPGVRVLEAMPLPYRDDNRFVWAFDETDRLNEDSDFLPARRPSVRRYVSAVEMANEVDCELAGDDAQEIWVCATEFFPYEDEGVSYNAKWGVERLPDPRHYPEWDYQAQLFRPDWTCVVEHRPVRGDPQVMARVVERHRSVASRIRRLIDALQPRGIVRHRGYEEGEELDLNAAVGAMIDIRRGVMPDTRISVRVTRQVRDLATVLLLDLSESTNDPIDKSDPDGHKIGDVIRDAAGLLSWAMDAIGDQFAVHAFASEGRHDVRYLRLKDFDQRYDDEARARIAGTQGALSTRMGAALRHAGWHLSNRDATNRLVLLVTDGAPADIDERDPRYLRDDARKAVEELAARGIAVFCLSLDKDADPYVARIFGESRYGVVDRVDRLPERLPAVFASLTG